MQCYQNTQRYLLLKESVWCVPCARHEGMQGTWRYDYSSFTSALGAGELSAPRPDLFTPWKEVTVPVTKDVAWVQTSVWTFRKGEKPVAPCCELTHRSAASLYHLSWSPSWEMCCWTKFHNPDSSVTWDVTSSSCRPFWYVLCLGNRTISLLQRNSVLFRATTISPRLQQSGSCAIAFLTDWNLKCKVWSVSNSNSDAVSVWNGDRPLSRLKQFLHGFEATRTSELRFISSST